MKKSAQGDANTARAGCCNSDTARPPPARYRQDGLQYTAPLSLARCNNALSASRSNCSKRVWSRSTGVILSRRLFCWH